MNINVFIAPNRERLFHIALAAVQQLESRQDIGGQAKKRLALERVALEAKILGLPAQNAITLEAFVLLALMAARRMASVEIQEPTKPKRTRRQVKPETPVGDQATPEPGGKANER